MSHLLRRYKGSVSLFVGNWGWSPEVRIGAQNPGGRRGSPICKPSISHRCHEVCHACGMSVVSPSKGVPYQGALSASVL